MAERGLYKQREPGSLKEAVAALVLACIGQRRAAELTRVSTATMARYTDDSGDNENFQMPVDIVAVLESHCGDPVVTRFLASRTAHALIDLDPSTLTKPYPVLLADIGKETGGLFSYAAAAMADGKLSDKEKGKVRRAALELATAAMCLVADIDRKAVA